MKVLLHIDDDVRWTQMMNNALNLLDYDDESMFEIVANGSAVKSLLKETPLPIQQRIIEFIDRGGKVCACHHSLERLSKTNEDVLEGIDIVPFGIVEVVQRQEDGFSYVKP